MAEEEVQQIEKDEETKAEVKVAPKKKRKVKKHVPKVRVTIQASFNNTLISAADSSGNVLFWGTSGTSGFKGSRKGTPYAATMATKRIVDRIKEIEPTDIELYIKGVGPGREASIRSLAASGLPISLIKDVTPLAHNGVRQKKARRV